MNLKTSYLGIELKNPLVPSASPLSRSLETAKRLEDAGASAIVLNSLFEEEIRAEDSMLNDFFMLQEEGHAEAAGYRSLPEDFCCEIDEYLIHIVHMKEALDMPVIASLNANSVGAWVEHALEIEQSGADALELNIYHIPADINETGEQVEQRYLDVLEAVKKNISIPVTMKLGSQFSSVGNMVKRLEAAGADGVALFNRFYQPTINLDTLEVEPALTLSHSPESLLRMRWIAILFGKVDLSLAATGGVHTAEDALRILLAGADVTHMCSALLKHGPEYLGQVLHDMEAWLEEKEYDSIEQMKGSVSQEHSPDPCAYERANYMRVLRSYGSS